MHFKLQSMAYGPGWLDESIRCILYELGGNEAPWFNNRMWTHVCRSMWHRSCQACLFSAKDRGYKRWICLSLLRDYLVKSLCLHGMAYWYRSLQTLSGRCCDHKQYLRTRSFIVVGHYSTIQYNTIQYQYIMVLMWKFSKQMCYPFPITTLYGGKAYRLVTQSARLQ